MEISYIVPNFRLVPKILVVDHVDVNPLISSKSSVCGFLVFITGFWFLLLIQIISLCLLNHLNQRQPLQT